MGYRRHGKLEREAGDGIVEVLLVLLREHLVVLVRRAAVPRNECIHIGWRWRLLLLVLGRSGIDLFLFLGAGGGGDT